MEHAAERYLRSPAWQEAFACYVEALGNYNLGRVSRLRWNELCLLKIRMVQARAALSAIERQVEEGQATK